MGLLANFLQQCLQLFDLNYRASSNILLFVSIATTHLQGLLWLTHTLI